MRVIERLTHLADVVTDRIGSALEHPAHHRCTLDHAVCDSRGLDRLFRMGCYEVSLGDTIGVGVPLQTKKIVKMFLSEFPTEKLALHFHDTRGTALANVLAGLTCGVRTFDASSGGLGGCPYAPGASGNLGKIGRAHV